LRKITEKKTNDQIRKSGKMAPRGTWDANQVATKKKPCRRPERTTQHEGYVQEADREVRPRGMSGRGGREWVLKGNCLPYQENQGRGNRRTSQVKHAASVGELPKRRKPRKREGEQGGAGKRASPPVPSLATTHCTKKGGKGREDWHLAETQRGQSEEKP